MSQSLPHRLLAWYGDDFTGSTDVLEMLSLYGLASVLFLEPPSVSQWQRFGDCRAFGLAGSSRSRSPQWMDENLPAAFEWLASIGTPLCHYKVCSTFDSSPQVGSIGRALEIGQRVLDVRWSPVLAGAPALQRYTAFGNLFAGADYEIFRIDRHPTMSRHPVTPMTESDLLVHLSRQTHKRLGLMSFLDLNSPAAASTLQAKAGSADAVFIDVLDQSTLRAAGSLIWNEASQRRVFVVGSSGVEHALAFAWGLTPAPMKPAAPADRLLVLSGSASPVTAAQIAYAASHGFASVRLDAARLAAGETAEAVINSAILQSLDCLSAGRSVILSTASAPQDRLPAEVASRPGFREALGKASGHILQAVLDQSSVRRVVVAGGDTSGFAGSQLEIEALTFLNPLTPGAPLCRGWSSNPRRDGIEIVFKGGQCGNEDFFLIAQGVSPPT